MFSEWLLSDWKKSGGSGGGGGRSDDNGCVTIVLMLLACLALSAMCSNSRVNENYLRPLNQPIADLIIETEA